MWSVGNEKIRYCRRGTKEMEGSKGEGSAYWDMRREYRRM